MLITCKCISLLKKETIHVYMFLLKDLAILMAFWIIKDVSKQILILDENK